MEFVNRDHRPCRVRYEGASKTAAFGKSREFPRFTRPKILVGNSREFLDFPEISSGIYGNLIES